MSEIHHSDVEATAEDRARGEALAHVLGDLFLDETCSPALQWTEITKALRLNKLKIVEERPSSPIEHPCPVCGAKPGHGCTQKKGFPRFRDKTTDELPWHMKRAEAVI